MLFHKKFLWNIKKYRKPIIFKGIIKNSNLKAWIISCEILNWTRRNVKIRKWQSFFKGVINGRMIEIWNTSKFLENRFEMRVQIASYLIKSCWR